MFLFHMPITPGQLRSFVTVASLAAACAASLAQDAEQVVREWAAKFESVSAVRVGWVSIHEGVTTPRSARYDDALLSWPNGFRIAEWRLNVPKDLPTADIPKYVQRKVDSWDHRNPPESGPNYTIGHPDGQLLNTRVSTRSFTASARPDDVINPLSARRASFLLGRWLMDEDNLNSCSATLIDESTVRGVVSKPRFAFELTKISSGFVLTRIDSFDHNGAVQTSNRFREFRAVEGYPEPVPSFRDRYQPVYDHVDIRDLASARPGPLRFKGSDMLACFKVLPTASPFEFEVNLVGLTTTDSVTGNILDSAGNIVGKVPLPTGMTVARQWTVFFVSCGVGLAVIVSGFLWWRRSSPAGGWTT